MRKNYFLSLLLLMIAFWNVEAKEREISNENAPTSITMAPALPTPTSLGYTPVGGTNTSLNLTWRNNATGNVSFQIAITTDGINFRDQSGGSAAAPGIAGQQVTGLSAGQTYKLYVRAYTATGGPTDNYNTCPNPVVGLTEVGTRLYSCWSAPITVTTSPDAPNPPSNASIVESTPASARSLTVNFTDNSTNEDKFIIERADYGSDAFVKIAEINGIAGTGRRTYIDNSVQPATLYKYKIIAYNVSGASAGSAITGLFETMPDPPQAPSELISPWQTLNTIRLEWTINSTNQTAFVIERSVDNASWVVVTDNWFQYTNFFEETNLIEGQQYFYRIKAVNRGGQSGYTNVLPVSTKKRVPPPSPYDLAAKTISPYRIDLNWSNQMFGEYDIPKSIEIYRSSTSATDGFTQIAILSPEQYTYSDTTGKPKTKYWYRLLSANEFGQSGYSNVATATTLGPPSIPTNLQVIASQDSLFNNILVARWTDASDDEDYFVLERSTDVNFTTNVLTTNLVKNYTSATSIPFDEGVTYFFRIRAVNEHGSSEFSEVTSITSFFTAVPNKPFALKATAATRSITLKWGDDSNKEEGFEIERSTDGTNFGQVTKTNRNVTTYVDNTVAANTKYWYRVRAVNPRGSSDYSNVVEVSTPAAATGFVGELTTTSNDTWQVYPNPTADAVRVKLPESMQNEVGVVTIIDRMNREVVRTKLNGKQSEYRFDLSNFSEGTYTISIRTNTQQITKRVYKY